MKDLVTSSAGWRIDNSLQISLNMYLREVEPVRKYLAPPDCAVSLCLSSSITTTYHDLNQVVTILVPV